MVTQKAKETFTLMASHEKKQIAKKANVQLSYLRNIFYSGAVPSTTTAVKIEKASGGKIRRNQILPDFDWSIF